LASTAIQTDPDITLVDEVLAVWDEALQKKYGDKIEESGERVKQ
jgi:ABC-type polysaccharide/polyol phosphate transport system ATPase subunit